MAILSILKSLVPFLPLITKYIDKKRAKTTGLTEVGQIGYGAALLLIVQDVLTCNPELTLQSLECITSEHWGFLGVAISYSAARFNSKKDGENNE